MHGPVYFFHAVGGRLLHLRDGPDTCLADLGLDLDFGDCRLAFVVKASDFGSNVGEFTHALLDGLLIAWLCRDRARKPFFYGCDTHGVRFKCLFCLCPEVFDSG